MPDGSPAARDEYVVQMKKITKVYSNGVAANQGVDFNLRRGEIHALMGENGAGKSTLMKMLFGLEQPTSGEIVVNGEVLNLSSPSVAISHAGAEPVRGGKHGARDGSAKIRHLYRQSESH